MRVRSWGLVKKWDDRGYCAIMGGITDRKVVTCIIGVLLCAYSKGSSGITVSEARL
jgi:hypothetical protein